MAHLLADPRPARADRCISITVKAIPDGVVSNHLVHRARAGQMLQLAQAEGDFVLPDPMPAKLLLVTAGSGITPVIGMLRNLFSRAEPVATDISLVHVNVIESSAIFRDELRAHAAAGRHHASSSATTTPTACSTSPHPEQGLAALVPDLAERLAYACGPAGLLDALEAHHADRGLALHHRALPPGRPRRDAGEGGTVTFADRHHASRPTAPPRSSTPAEYAGVLMPSGCRMGICFGCVLPLARAPCATCATARSPSPSPARPAPRASRSRPASAPPPAPAPSTTDRPLVAADRDHLFPTPPRRTP